MREQCGVIIQSGGHTTQWFVACIIVTLANVKYSIQSLLKSHTHILYKTNANFDDSHYTDITFSILCYI